MGKRAQMNETCRQDRNAPKPITINIPKLNDITESEANRPRSDDSLLNERKWIFLTGKSEISVWFLRCAYLISLTYLWIEINWNFNLEIWSNSSGIEWDSTYVIDGVSFNPIQSPSTRKPKQTIGNDCENPSIIQEAKSGTLTTMNDFRRPILSQMGPLSKLPIGCATWAKLAIKIIDERCGFKVIRHKTTYTATTFRLLKHESFRLDSSLCWGRLTMVSRLTARPKIGPNWRYRNSSPSSRWSKHTMLQRQYILMHFFAAFLVFSPVAKHGEMYQFLVCHLYSFQYFPCLLSSWMSSFSEHTTLKTVK